MRARLTKDLTIQNYFHFTMSKRLTKDSLKIYHLQIGNTVFPGEMTQPNTFSFSYSNWDEIPTVLSHELSFVLDDTTIRCGPVLMILTDASIPSSNFSSYESFYREMVQYGEQLGAVTYILPLNEYQSYVNNTARVLTADGWQKGYVPLPTTVYNRVHKRSVEFSQGMDWLRAEFKERKILFFNDRYVSKWDVHEALTTEPSFRAYLPTTQFAQYESFYDFLQSKESFFVKPIWGSLGKGIILVSYQEELGQWIVMDKKKHLFSSLKKACQYLETSSKKSPHIIQKKIPLIASEQRPVDFRIHLIATNSATFEVTSTIARVSAQDKIVSNLSQGGELLKPLNVLKKTFPPGDAEISLTLMKELSIEMATHLSHTLSGHFLEFGMDMGVDDNGKPWLIECNIKPSKQHIVWNGVRPSTKAIWKRLFERSSVL